MSTRRASSLVGMRTLVYSVQRERPVPGLLQPVQIAARPGVGLRDLGSVLYSAG